MEKLRKLSNNFSDKIYLSVNSEKGQALVEYALILLLIAVVVVIMVTGVGQKTNDFYSTINSSIPQN